MGLTFRLFREETAVAPILLAVDNTQSAMTETHRPVVPLPVKSIESATNVETIWPPEMREIIKWFMELETPTESFYLEPHIRVIGPEKFFASLRREIESGPSCPRGRNGALLHDLDILRKKLH